MIDMFVQVTMDVAIPVFLAQQRLNIKLYLLNGTRTNFATSTSLY